MNGAAAHLITAGEQVIIMGFELCDGPIEPQVILVDSQNRFDRDLTERPATSLDAANHAAVA